MTDHDSTFDPVPHASDAPDLTSYDAEFDTVAAADTDEVPDGKYQVRVQGVRLARSQKNDPMLKWDLVVISGAHAKRHIFKNSVITQASLPYVKADLKLLGLELAKFSDLASRLDELLDHTLEVTKRTRADYANVYFNKRIAVPSGGAPATASDAPF